jgi:hypothetical protein
LSAYPSTSAADQAAAYERDISENWDSMPAFEQEQAKAYLQAKFQGAPQSEFASQPMPQYTAGNPYLTTGMQQPGYGYGSPAYGYPGYGPGAFGPPKRDEAEWAIWLGYVGVFVFTPLAIFCGIKNLINERPGHGWVQLLLGLAPWILLMLIAAS